MYETNKKRLPKKNTDINNIRCILKAINDHFHVSCELLKVDKEKFNTYFITLEKNNVIVKIGNNNKYLAENYNISCSPQDYNRYIKNGNLNAMVGLNAGPVSASVKISA